MIYDIRHITTYAYESSVSFSLCALRLRPTSRAGQKVLSVDVTLDPPAAQRTPRFCFFGNSFEIVRVDDEHRELKVTAKARIAVARPEAPAVTPPWEEVRQQAFGAHDLGPQSPAHFIYASRAVSLDEPVVAYARTSFPPDREILAGARDLMRRIWDDFDYDPKATLVSTPLGEAFSKKKGVCQDFAHIMIAGLRGLGLPARYVSGYLRTAPPPGQKRLEGADATHAWVAVWCGPFDGWVGLDPTNNICVGDDHIILAEGRDYADVAPIEGVILSTGGQDVSVAVDVIPVAAENAPPTFK
ncbi:transglutaminase [Rhodoblastus sphagnicola]|uniref:Transglutaminase n=1 Tax=Rhodoblastus sphagnicola TaxID=333368 RepID=A0A2S6N582_9HYPH|nr:transglutaminase family protein [Rhodoblastus sphagnicola]MBB4197139.1 transglutaminase-like putative cysteine protease [Rhodoblastus sphagnicola]PPQ29759.1 transglutaminase [Rhodoblastus sphagnicola]